MTNLLEIRPVSKSGFSDFGDLIKTEGAEMRLINNGSTTRFHDLATVETLGEDAHTLINIFRGQPFSPPIEITMMERHPFGSQAFMPLQKKPFLAVVARDMSGVPGMPEAFLVPPGSGISYRANTWHHPLLSLETESDFLVIDRGGKGDNLEEYFYPDPYIIESIAI